jgi:pilus assembly protein CpaE
MRVVLATESVQQREVVRRSVLGVGLNCDTGDCVDLSGLALRLARGNVDLVLVGVEGRTPRALSVIQEASQRSNQPVLAVGPTCAPSDVVELLRSGAREYLDQTRMQEELVAALDRLRRAGVVENRQGRAVGVISAAPGSGVTTLSSGLAFGLAGRKEGPVLLAEVGTGVPEFALQLNLQPTHTLKELLREWERVDATMLRQTLSEHPLGVHILCANTTGLTPPQILAATMRQLLVLGRNLFEHTVFDLGHGLVDGTLDAIRHLDTVLVVTRVEIPSLHLTKRLLKVLTGQYGIPAERLQLVGNRSGQSGQLSRKKVEEVLGFQLWGWLPDEPSTTIRAQNEGRALQEIAPRYPLCRGLTDLATRLHAVPVA